MVCTDCDDIKHEVVGLRDFLNTWFTTIMTKFDSHERHMETLLKLVSPEDGLGQMSTTVEHEGQIGKATECGSDEMHNPSNRRELSDSGHDDTFSEDMAPESGANSIEEHPAGTSEGIKPDFSQFISGVSNNCTNSGDLATILANFSALTSTASTNTDLQSFSSLQSAMQTAVAALINASTPTKPTLSLSSTSPSSFGTQPLSWSSTTGSSKISQPQELTPFVSRSAEVAAQRLSRSSAEDGVPASPYRKPIQDLSQSPPCETDAQDAVVSWMLGTKPSWQTGDVATTPEQNLCCESEIVADCVKNFENSEENTIATSSQTNVTPTSCSTSIAQPLDSMPTSIFPILSQCNDSMLAANVLSSYSTLFPKPHTAPPRKRIRPSYATASSPWSPRKSSHLPVTHTRPSPVSGTSTPSSKFLYPGSAGRIPAPYSCDPGSLLTEDNVCTICGKKLSMRGNGLKHVKLHIFGKTLQCPHCPNKFSQSSNLKNHILARHLREPKGVSPDGLGQLELDPTDPYSFPYPDFSPKCPKLEGDDLPTGTQQTAIDADIFRSISAVVDGFAKNRNQSPGLTQPTSNGYSVTINTAYSDGVVNNLVPVST